ncbi:MAG: AAA family ATPase [Oscillatoriales cyanobacterium SM2_3_0]|nr:AAA family ATPase [Oscillatoriales cyanobacterium SM2_3_0]
MACLILMIGLPGSGKSFLSQQLIQNHYPEYCLTSTDQIRARLFGDEAIQGHWLQVWQQVEQQFYQGMLYPGLIYDATNTQRRHRREVVDLARTVGFQRIMGIWVNLSLQICLERNQQRSRQVPEEIILRMARQLQGAPPALSEGFDSLVIISGAIAPPVRSVRTLR